MMEAFWRILCKGEVVPVEYGLEWVVSTDTFRGCFSAQGTYCGMAGDKGGGREVKKGDRFGLEARGQLMGYIWE